MTSTKSKRCKTCNRRPPKKNCTDCQTCRSRKYRQNNPMFAAYRAMKDNAKRRHKIFTITFAFADFKEFCYREDYMAGRGRTKESYSVDCIVNERGYVRGNLQRLTVSQNARKGTKALDYNWQTGEAVVHKYNDRDQADNAKDMPF